MQRNLLRVLDCKEPSCQKTIEGAPRISEHLCPECTGHFNSLKEYLGYLQIPFELDPYLVRGLDYYTRTVFEVQPEGGGAQNVLGGGGRYDGLIEKIGGKPTPGIGFGTGIERIILNLQKQNIKPPPVPGPQVYVAYLGGNARKEAIKLIARLRQADIGAILATEGKSLKAQLKQANALGTVRTIIIGEDEVTKGCVVLRDMSRGEQTEVPQDKIVSLLLKTTPLKDGIQ